LAHDVAGLVPRLLHAKRGTESDVAAGGLHGIVDDRVLDDREGGGIGDQQAEVRVLVDLAVLLDLAGEPDAIIVERLAIQITRRLAKIPRLIGGVEAHLRLCKWCLIGIGQVAGHYIALHFRESPGEVGVARCCARRSIGLFLLLGIRAGLVGLLFLLLLLRLGIGARLGVSLFLFFLLFRVFADFVGPL